MSYFKISRVFTVGGTDATVTVQCGGNDSGTSSLAIPELKKAWGVMRGTATAGTVTFDSSGSIDIGHLIAGQVYPCNPRAVTATSGSVYILM